MGVSSAQAGALFAQERVSSAQAGTWSVQECVPVSDITFSVCGPAIRYD